MDAFLLWQLADSALPTGGFAHAGGLESARALGLVSDGDDLEAFAVEALRGAGSFALPFVAAAHRDPGAFDALDLRCDACTPGEVANRASRAQGQGLLRAGAVVVGGPVTALAERVRSARLPGHLPPVHGAVLRAAGADLDDTCRLFLFGALRGLCAAAVRLGLAGPMEAQGLQARLAPEAEAVARTSAGLDVEDVAHSNPLLDLVQSHQDRLYSRLFRS
jgi:urease accessory protein